MKRTLFGASIAFTALLSACGGGGTSADAGGTSSGLLSNTVTVQSTALRAGQSTPISARAIMRGAAPSSMVWSATPLYAVGATDEALLFNDLNCASATYAAPAITGASGEGSCQAILTAPAGAKSGVWRITNTASSSVGSVSNSVEVTIAGLPASGFRLLESSTPLTGYVNKPLSLAIPFTINPGAIVTNVKYLWTAAAENPSIIAIAGARNSMATVIPLAAGQYRFDVAVTADVNGYPATATGSVVAAVYPATFVDIIDAGMPKIVTPGSPVSLIGAILNRDDTLVYTTSWRQLDGVLGGPVALTLSNMNSSSASFIAPDTIGTYGFEYKVIKFQPDGTQAITTAQTSVLVQAAPTGVFTVSAGDVQTVAVGSPAILHGSVGTQGSTSGVTYSYLWAQSGGTPMAVTLSNPNSATASFIPAVAGTYTFDLVVTATTAGGSTTVTGRTQVLATSTGTTVTSFAIAVDAGAAKSVPSNSVTSLTGSQTTQGSAVGVTYAYAWTQVGTTPAVVTLSNANTASATFLPTVSGVYSFRLTVTATLTDGTTRTGSADTQIIVGGVGNTFTVSAGDAQVVTENTAATMVGVVTTQGSFSGATFSYAWEQLGSTPDAVTVSNATSLTASFVPTVTGTYTFELTVTSVEGGVTTTHTSQTQVLVQASIPPV